MYILLRGKVTVYHQYNKSDLDDRPSLLPTSGANKSESLRHALGTFVTHIGVYTCHIILNSKWPILRTIIHWLKSSGANPIAWGWCY